MKTRSKVLLLALVAILLVVTTVFATLAYLTSEVETVTNTFTIGNISITLNEADVDEYGKVIEGADRVQDNNYKLIPGHTYVKDPTVHVQPGSEASYLFAVVKDETADIQADTKVAAQIVANGWTAFEDTAAAAAGYAVYYKEAAAVAENVDAVDYVIFNNLTIGDEANVASYADAKIVVKAAAIQKDGIEDVATAWAELEGKFAII